MPSWRRPPGSERDVLRTLWSRWTSIVELYALRRPARRRVDPAAYQSLRSDLIAACRNSVGAPEGLDGLVSPWLSPKTLGQADSEILHGLLARCQDVERELGGHRAWSSGGLGPRIGRLRPVASLAARTIPGVLALAGLITLLKAASPEPIAALDWPREWARSILLALSVPGDAQRLAALALVIVPGAILMLRGLARS